MYLMSQYSHQYRGIAYLLVSETCISTGVKYAIRLYTSTVSTQVCVIPSHGTSLQINVKICDAHKTDE